MSLRTRNSAMVSHTVIVFIRYIILELLMIELFKENRTTPSHNPTAIQYLYIKCKAEKT
ncbi:hypothetical protein acsn021_01270 [Anaerocolumna cellulosilytica]|uniref:Uncharacterized protein n=1 Tax=Anaerocolumna cellulosilytica TaxID=433286 RepID=A0A6S6R0P3_9FIRM|nr:hypothetical protein [Anaerocolumna cellulosilytica]BCJ92558.1 hypothetical protein acsn021_01270 [Anaerocolumna cellulosilytica]